MAQYYIKALNGLYRPITAAAVLQELSHGLVNGFRSTLLFVYFPSEDFFCDEVMTSDELYETGEQFKRLLLCRVKCVGKIQMFL